MASPTASALRQAIRSVAKADSSGLTDRELLRRFVERDDQAAFTALVNRHSGMLLGVCRRALPTVQDAEDACQATFLLLARKAKTGHWQASVANWLYATARKVARNALVAAQRRARREAKAGTRETVESIDRMSGRELLAFMSSSARHTSRDPRTDADGLFHADGLVPGLKYHLAVYNADPARSVEDMRWTTLVFRDVMLKAGEKKDLGDVTAQAFPKE